MDTTEAPLYMPPHKRVAALRPNGHQSSLSNVLLPSSTQLAPYMFPHTNAISTVPNSSLPPQRSINVQELRSDRPSLRVLQYHPQSPWVRRSKSVPEALQDVFPHKRSHSGKGHDDTSVAHTDSQAKGGKPRSKSSDERPSLAIHQVANRADHHTVVAAILSNDQKPELSPGLPSAMKNINDLSSQDSKIENTPKVDEEALQAQRTMSENTIAGLIKLLDSILATARSLTQHLGFVAAMPQTDPILEMVFGINEMVRQYRSTIDEIDLTLKSISRPIDNEL